MLSQQVPEPLPTPSELAPPTPIQIEQLFHLPPEVIEKLTSPDPGGLTQPVATLIAAGIALAAACIAWCGVQRQINANRANTYRQLATQRHLHRETRKAELQKQTRTDRLLALQAAVAALVDVRSGSREVVWLSQTNGSVDKKKYQLLVGEAISQSSHARAKLILVGLGDAEKIYNTELERMGDVRRRAVKGSRGGALDTDGVAALIQELNQATVVYRELALVLNQSELDLVQAGGLSESLEAPAEVSQAEGQGA